jgi:hypothetical protein
MKKLSLEMLRLTSDEVLQRSQMKKITGGGKYYCECTAGPGKWEGNYGSDMEAARAIGTWCEGGMGTCSGAPQQ